MIQLGDIPYEKRLLVKGGEQARYTYFRDNEINFRDRVWNVLPKPWEENLFVLNNFECDH